jgi:hypothetical protein
MDKGKEALEKYLAEYIEPKCHTKVHPYVASLDIEEIFRSHGWLRDDDIVEGKFICDSAIHDCPQRTGNLCLDDEHNCYNRPATVKDLIGGK